MKKNSILIWVFITLIIVGSLPFLLSWYQIQDSKNNLINQTQTSHMIISRATADRIGHHVNKYVELANSLGDNPGIYQSPNSIQASEIIKSTLIANNDVTTIGLILNNGDQKEIIQILNKKKSDNENIEKFISVTSNQNTVIFNYGNKDFLKITQETARPNVYIKLIVLIEFKKYLNPQILGDSASLDVITSKGEIVASSMKEPMELSNEMINQAKLKHIKSSASHNEKSQNIVSYASIEKTPWSIISRQPTKFAESATTQMRETAWKAFFIVFSFMSLLLLLAYYSWVRPIKRLVKSYNKLMGNTTGQGWKGNEISQLEESFDKLSQHIQGQSILSETFVDRYLVISAIGFGGMGSVFLGWDPRLKRHVALKTLPIEKTFGTREDMSDILVQEAVTAAKISHCNIVSIYDVVSTQNTAFIAMEYVNGESLHSLLQRIKKLTISNALAIIIAISKGLKAAHEAGFIHRDIKPENILLGRNGDIKLTDFGITVLMQSIQEDKITGSPAYMSPEIYQHGKASVQSDLFALGVVLATSILGENPFKAKTVKLTEYNILNKSIDFSNKTKAQSWGKLATVLDQVLDKNPDNRPKSAEELIELIREAAPNNITWDPVEIGIQSTREKAYAKTDNTTVVNVNHT